MKFPQFAKICVGLVTSALLLSACRTGLPPEPYQPVVLNVGEPAVLYVAGTRHTCASVKPMQCLSAQNDSGHAFELPYNAIVGFEPKIGVAYKILARPQMDAAGVLHGWVLDEIFSQVIDGNVR